MAAARRADPAFSPTRYISTRTAVRCGAILRAACIYEKIFHLPDRTLEVEARDLMALRLHLLLSGPSREDIDKLLASEVDPVEKRQLAIMRTEREIFEACYAKLPPIRPLRRPPPMKKAPAPPPEGEKAGAPPAGSPAGAGGAAVGTAVERELRAELARRARQVRDAEQARDMATLVTATRELATLASDGAPLADEAFEAFERATAAVETVGLRSLALATDPQATVGESVSRVVELAQLLDDGRASNLKTAAFMRRRALAMLEDAIGLSGSGEAIRSALADGADPSDATSKRIDELKRLTELRRRLLAKGPADGASGEEALARAFDRAEHELAALWAGAFARAFGSKRGADRSIEDILGELRPELSRLRQIDRMLGDVIGREAHVMEKVAAPRVGELVQGALAKTRPGDRAAFVRQVATLLETLEEFGLRKSVDVGGWLGHAAGALVASEPPADAPSATPKSRKGFLAMRAAEQRTPIACTLAEVALAVAPELASSEDAAMERVSGAIDALPDAVKDSVARHDVGRIARAVDYLEAWWTELEGAPPAALLESQFFEVLWDDAALARFSVEARLVEEAIPGARDAARAIRERIDALNAKAHAASVAVLEKRADEEWRRASAAT
ncbi:MAG TPA: hypothetical protein VL400_01265, partial [Polyangiaceae bacterium]|nr:hypothetical protein [Polyangiaceae bacterium]